MCDTRPRWPSLWAVQWQRAWAAVCREQSPGLGRRPRRSSDQSGLWLDHVAAGATQGHGQQGMGHVRRRFGHLTMPATRDTESRPRVRGHLRGGGGTRRHDTQLGPDRSALGALLTSRRGCGWSWWWTRWLAPRHCGEGACGRVRAAHAPHAWAARRPLDPSAQAALGAHRGLRTDTLGSPELSMPGSG